MLTEIAEAAVIGSVMVDESAAALAFAQLSPEDFEDGEIRKAFEDMADVYEEYGKIDIALASKLPSRSAILQCMETLPSISNYREYVRCVKAESSARQARAIAGDIFLGEYSGDEILERAGKIMDTVRQDTGVQNLSMQELSWQWLQEQADKTDRSLKTGFATLDRSLRIMPGDFVIVGGRPSSGKTAFSLQLAEMFARRGKRVIYFSYETAPAKLFNRMVSNSGHLLLADILNKRVDTGAEATRRALEYLNGLPLRVVQAAGKSVAWCGSVAAEYRADVILVDYLGLIPAKGASRYEQVTNVSLALHTLAQQTGRTVVALSQLKRVEGAARPTMQDLRESGQVEQDADAVILLHSNREKSEYAVVLAKNKEGITGEMPIVFDGPYQTFYEAEE